MLADAGLKATHHATLGGEKKKGVRGPEEIQIHGQLLASLSRLSHDDSIGRHTPPADR